MQTTSKGVEIRGAVSPAQEAILAADAVQFVAALEREFRGRRDRVLRRRRARQRRLDNGHLPDFWPQTRHIRAGGWRVHRAPNDLQDRRVEITGPVDRKMVINALNSGADVFMADFEDSNAPTWNNCIDGQLNLRDAVRREIAFADRVSGKRYQLNERIATLVVRPRGWHLDEAHLAVDGRAVSASIFDFALYLFHNHAALRASGTGPYFYLPKLESRYEARLWNEVFVAAQRALGVPVGTIKATVLIETITAAFEMDEILYELRDHIVGLNCGRWDYIFSFIKRLQKDARFVLPDRALVGMTSHFLRSYSLLLIKTCHRRGAHAMGGMAAQIPIKNDEARNAEAMAKVRADKKREAGDGHDGTWVAHPGLVPIAREEFGEHGPNQLDKLRDDVEIRAADLLTVPAGPRTEAGLRTNIRVGIRYLEAWLSGNGCVPIDNLMEDAATAEISRAQVWQWLYHGVTLDDGRVVDTALVDTIVAEEVDALRTEVGEPAFVGGRFALATELFVAEIHAPELREFLTLPAYHHITQTTSETTR